ncbi:unnamed protein product [Echinostoma caproni]|uniref:Ovule protein n=1 Tax=Echinostoma caproni TaxID=27848 RepID=A0A183A917_9TREM|nr:unnamed protein product [Echinostoma caproni]
MTRSRIPRDIGWSFKRHGVGIRVSNLKNNNTGDDEDENLIDLAYAGSEASLAEPTAFTAHCDKALHYELN